MEYIMTYGWAIVILSVVVVALYASGVFSSSSAFAPKAQPGACYVSRSKVAPSLTSLVGMCNGENPEFTAQFNGQSSGVSVTDTSGLDMSSGGFSVAAWIYWTGKGTQNYVVDKSGKYTLSLNGGGTAGDPQFSVGSVAAASSFTLSPNAWYFLVGTYSGGTVRLYVNGQYITSGSSATQPTSGGNLELGCAATSCGSTYSFSGAISNIQLYNTSLSAAQIQALYQAGIGGAPVLLSRLAGWWPLNGDVVDYSGSNNNGAATSIAANGTWSATSGSITLTSCYLLTLIVGSGGAAATPSPTNSVGCPAYEFVSGASITLTATNSVGYSFSGWSGYSSNSMSPWPFTMPASAATETASFSYPGGTYAWGMPSQLKVAEDSLSCVISGGYIYCMGGDSADGTVQSAQILGGGSVSAFQTTNPLKDEELFESCVTSGSYIYCMGGSPSGSVVQSAQILGGGSVSTWQTTASLNTAEEEMSCVTDGSYIYCMGGFPSDTTVQYAQILGGGSVSTWHTTTSLTDDEDSLSCVISGGYIYCMGGSEHLGAVQYAQILGGGSVSTWQYTTGLAIGTYDHSCVTAVGYIYCMGGYNGYDSGGTPSPVQSAQILGGGLVSTWLTTSPLYGNTGTYVGMGCVTDGSYIYCMGGSYPDSGMCQSAQLVS